MPLIYLVLLLILIGLLLYIVPMDPGLKDIVVKICIVVAVVALVFWVLGVFGVLPARMGNLRIGP